MSNRLGAMTYLVVLVNTSAMHDANVTMEQGERENWGSGLLLVLQHGPDRGALLRSELHHGRRAKRKRGDSGAQLTLAIIMPLLTLVQVSGEGLLYKIIAKIIKKQRNKVRTLIEQSGRYPKERSSLKAWGFRVMELVQCSWRDFLNCSAVQFIACSCAQLNWETQRRIDSGVSENAVVGTATPKR
jgi:hypothetical protein